MPGLITSLSQFEARGFAIHPRLWNYNVLVHAVHKTKILRSVIANDPPPTTREQQSPCWFNINLSDLSLSTDDIKQLTFLIGETDEILEINGVMRTDLSASQVQVEEMVYTNVRRLWITGATYIEAEQAGLPDADIIDLLYIDILGRRADPGGLASYLDLRVQSKWTFGDIRKSLVYSAEYADRRKDAAWAPGAIFSHPITELAASASSNARGRLRSQASKAVARPAAETAAKRGLSGKGKVTSKAAINGTGKDKFAEIALPADSALFGSGWHGVEYLNDVAFRWMEMVGTIFNPKPELPCIRISLEVAAVYGTDVPMIDCFIDNVAAAVQVDRNATGFLITISPTESVPQPYMKLRIESRVSGCPMREELSDDDRVLSLNVLSARISYQAHQDLTG